MITNITPAMDVYSEELFGPVAQLYKVSSDEEAIKLANSSPYGLGSVVICDDHERAERVGNQLDVGMVFIGAYDSAEPMYRSVVSRSPVMDGNWARWACSSSPTRSCSASPSNLQRNKRRPDH